MIINKDSDYLELQKISGGYWYISKYSLVSFGNIIIKLDYPIYSPLVIYAAGSIKSNVTIKSDSDIICDYDIEVAGDIEVGDSILTGGNIKASGYIKAGGDIIKAGGNIEAGGNIAAKDIRAGGKIFKNLNEKEKKDDIFLGLRRKHIAPQ